MKTKDSILEVVNPPHCYELSCIWEGQGDLITWILLHPTAPNSSNPGIKDSNHIYDRTIRRLKHWSQTASNMFKIRFGGFIAVFLFSRMVAGPESIQTMSGSGVELIGCCADLYLREGIRRGKVVVGAWGSSLPLSLILSRLRMIDSWAAQCGRRFFCIGSSQSGQPFSPDDIGLKKETKLRPLKDLDVWD